MICELLRPVAAFGHDLDTILASNGLVSRLRSSQGFAAPLMRTSESKGYEQFINVVRLLDLKFLCECAVR